MPTREDSGALGPGGPAAVAALEPGGPQRPEPGEVPAQDSPRWRILSAFVHSRQAVVGVGLVVLIALFCFAGPLIYRTNQVTVNLNLATMPPSASHPLGTDGSGYDVLGRLMLSGQSSLELGLAVSIATTVIGTLWGAIAGLAGGLLDSVMMRLVDVFLAIPVLLLLLILVNMVTPDLLVIIGLLTVLSWLTTARLVRGEVLTLRTRDYVQAVKMMGGGVDRTVVRHLIPNAIGVIIVSATFTVADAILTLSALSFLGLGLPPPQTDWGGMLSNGLSYLFDGYWWLVYPPAIALILTVLAFNLIGDAIRDSLDVRLQRL
jgi:peptide/nickel transport system permease protein